MKSKHCKLLEAQVVWSAWTLYITMDYVQFGLMLFYNQSIAAQQSFFPKQWEIEIWSVRMPDNIIDRAQFEFIHYILKSIENIANMSSRKRMWCTRA